MTTLTSGGEVTWAPVVRWETGRRNDWVIYRNLRKLQGLLPSRAPWDGRRPGSAQDAPQRGPQQRHRSDPDREPGAGPARDGAERERPQPPDRAGVRDLRVGPQRGPVPRAVGVDEDQGEVPDQFGGSGTGDAEGQFGGDPDGPVGLLDAGGGLQRRRAFGGGAQHRGAGEVPADRRHRRDSQRVPRPPR